MTDLLNTGRSALFAFQRALATTSHNIANVNTNGYARQRVDLEGVPATSGLDHQAGNGVRVASIERLQDQFATARVNASTSAYEEQQVHYSMANRLDSLLGSEGSSITPALNDFFNALQDANNDPSSVASREVVLNSAEQLSQRIVGMQSQFEDTQREAYERIQGATDTVSNLAQSIADLNRRIIGVSSAENPSAVNDLLDQRDKRVTELSKLIDIDTQVQENGALNVFMGKGMSLVIGTHAEPVKTVPDDTYPDRLQIQVGKVGSEKNISARLQGGEIGGLSEFVNQTLQPAMSELGRMSLSISEALNKQHTLGLDLNGDVGGSLFNMGTPHTYTSSDNAGDGAIQLDFANVDELAASDYLLRFDGANFVITRQSDGEQTVGGMPLQVDGLNLTLSGTPQAGDTFVISATSRIAGSMKAALSDADALALSGRLTTSSDFNNVGDSRIGVPRVVDPNNASLAQAVDIVFTSETSYDIVDTGSGSVLSSQSGYSDGDVISFNGWEVSITGDIHTGDSHRVEANVAGVGNNSNGLALADLQLALTVGGNQTVNQSYGALVARVGAQTNSAESRASALEALRNDAIDRQQAVQAVSLDEEAIDLTRYQQAYQASARIISVADDMFQTILGAVQ